MQRRLVWLAIAITTVLAYIPARAAGPEDEREGIGSLVWKTPAGRIDLPILRMDLDLDVHGIVAHGTLVQEFTNSTGEVIEAEYVLPLPERATVHAMDMRIGERRIVSQVKERAEARKTYDAARQEGKKAALVEQQRPNLFTTAVSGILPGETITVHIDVLQPVDYADGELQIAFPLTYTPRYGPDAGRSPNTVAPPPRVTIRASVDAGFPALSVQSPSHVIRTVREGRTTRIEPLRNPVAADRDFVLRIVPAKPPGPSGTVFVEDRPEGRYALVMLLPPSPPEHARGLATETLFVIDVSGSMEGPSLTAAREALLAALDRLRPEDTFNLLKFSDANDLFRSAAQPADGAHLADARDWVKSLEASGGTELVPALARALELTARGDPGRARRVILITDGAVSNEEEAFRTVTAQLGDTRLHILGIGAAPNRHLMRKLAQHGRGTCEFAATEAVAREKIDALFRRIERPVLRDVAIAWEGALPVDSFPEDIPDLYAGEPLFISVRLGIEHPGTRLVLTGRDEAGPLRSDLDIGPAAPADSGIAIAWARAKVDALVERLGDGADPAATRTDVIEIAKQFGLATRYTSLVAVEEVATATGEQTPVRVASAAPDGTGPELDTLPQGGSLDPLCLRLGVLLTVAGIASLWIGRRIRR